MSLRLQRNFWRPALYSIIDILTTFIRCSFLHGSTSSTNHLQAPAFINALCTPQISPHQPFPVYTHRSSASTNSPLRLESPNYKQSANPTDKREKPFVSNLKLKQEIANTSSWLWPIPCLLDFSETNPRISPYTTSKNECDPKKGAALNNKH